VSYNTTELWNIKIPSLDNIEGHILQIYFSPQYPVEPPIINIVSHVYKPGFHCVMEKGIIFIDSIVPCEWIPNSRIVHILKAVCKNLASVPSTMKEAKVLNIPHDEIIKTYHYLTNSLNLFNV
jgi:ubiquitin-protein ligase